MTCHLNPRMCFLADLLHPLVSLRNAHPDCFPPPSHPFVLSLVKCLFRIKTRILMGLCCDSSDSPSLACATPALSSLLPYTHSSPCEEGVLLRPPSGPLHTLFLLPECSSLPLARAAQRSLPLEAFPDLLTHSNPPITVSPSVRYLAFPALVTFAT